MKIDEIAKVLRHAVTNGFRRSIFVWGPPGCGKSSACLQAAEAEKVDFIDLRLAQCDPCDVRGVLGLDPQKGKSHWFLPDVLPTDEKSRGILCLDELNLAPPSVQAASYQLILDRRLGDYKVPQGWVIVACGNREEDRANVFELPKPLENRFVHINAEFDFDTWKRWAYASDIDPNVIAFLNAKSELACKPPSDAERGFPTPRSWAAVSDLMKAYFDVPNLRDEMIAGAVGQGAATEFLTFIKFAIELLPLVDKIAKGENIKISNLSKHFFVCGMLVEKYKSNPNLNDRVCGYAEFSNEERPESSYVLLKDAEMVDGVKGRKGLLQKSEHWNGAIKKLARFMV